MTFLRIHLAYRNIQRLRQIISILIKHGFYPVIERIHLTRLISIPQRIAGRKAIQEQEFISFATRTRLAFEDLGPTFIKFGQILSTRPDILPEEFIREFLKLQDEVPPFPFSDVVKVIEHEFKKPVKELFQDIQERKIYDPVGMVEEFGATIKKEMDFTLEASYTERFKKSLSDDQRILIPTIYWNLTGKKVLTMEGIDGIKIDNIEKLKQSGIDTEKIGHIVAETFFRQIFEFGIFHGDLHSGNIFVAGPEKIAFVDFGIVGKIDKEMQENLADVFVGLVTEDYELLTQVYLKMGILPEDIDEPAFKREYQDMLFAYFGKPFKMTSVGEVDRK